VPHVELKRRPDDAIRSRPDTVRSRKRFGQHFLEPTWVKKVVEAIRPSADDTVIEIGPGSGALTLALAPRVARLITVEVDRNLADDLEPLLPPHASVLRADFLTVDIPSLIEGLPHPVRVVGNLPYNISSPILFRLLAAHDDGCRIADATIMLQQEVAARLVAAPGGRDYGVLTVQAKLTADVTMAMHLPSGAFRPRPKVESALVCLAFRPPASPVENRARFERVVRAAFTLRRKTIANALKYVTGVDPATIAAVLSRTEILPNRRPQTLTVSEWIRLTAALPDFG
jgi:16S rRNA (adenine1518-N6/adenine1519-N6)-dimethyltransferase